MKNKTIEVITANAVCLHLKDSNKVPVAILYSYETPVLVERNNEYYFLPLWDYSRTTLKHIKTVCGLTKKEIEIFKDIPTYKIHFINNLEEIGINI